MTALLREAAGRRVCNARCYGSNHDAARCSCICGGRLHGTHGSATKTLESAVRTGLIPAALVVEEFSHLCDDPLPGMEKMT